MCVCDCVVGVAVAYSAGSYSLSAPRGHFAKAQKESISERERVCERGGGGKGGGLEEKRKIHLNIKTTCCIFNVCPARQIEIKLN